MFPPFNQKIANLYCLSTLIALEQGRLVLERLTPVSSERVDQGLMVGCLVGWKAAEACGGKCKRVVLLAVSGISRQLKFACDDKTILFNYIPEEYKSLLADVDAEIIIVPPIVDNEKINLALEKNDKEIHVLTEKINSLKVNKCKSTGETETLESLCKKRELLTDESLRNVFALYNFTRFDGKKISLNEIIKDHNYKLPPTGTGDCCAPKLLSYAFDLGLQIESMDEVYFSGKSPEKNPSGKINGNSYAPCDERCGYILPSILGLEIIYQDSEIVVVNKQSGLLSVPGRGEDKQDCIVSRVKRLFPQCIDQPSVHRLDMETSGLMVLGLTQAAHDNLNAQFENRLVQKKYEALLDGVLFKADGLNAPKNNEVTGTMELKFRLDVDNRPHQIYDEENGKLGITEWILENIENYKNPVTGKLKRVTRISFIPHTGRTHQLRLASSDSHGFNLPIVGDTLYGTCEPGERLMLHASDLSFTHPKSGERMEFHSKSPF